MAEMTSAGRYDATDEQKLAAERLELIEINAARLTDTREWVQWEGFCQARSLVGKIVQQLDDDGDHEGADWLHETVWKRLRDNPQGICPDQRNGALPS